MIRVTLEVRGYLHNGAESGYTYSLAAPQIHTLLHGSQLERDRTLRAVAGDFYEILDYAVVQRETITKRKLLRPFQDPATLEFLQSLGDDD